MIELDFQYPSEGIHKRWDVGYRITCAAATSDQAAFVLSKVRGGGACREWGMGGTECSGGGNLPDGL